MPVLPTTTFVPKVPMVGVHATALPAGSMMSKCVVLGSSW